MVNQETEFEILGRKRVKLDSSLSGLVGDEIGDLHRKFDGEIRHGTDGIKTLILEESELLLLGNQIPGHANFIVFYAGQHLEADKYSDMTAKLVTLGYETPDEREIMPPGMMNIPA